jgi:nucleoid-associated protein YgaU
VTYKGALMKVWWLIFVFVCSAVAYAGSQEPADTTGTSRIEAATLPGIADTTGTGDVASPETVTHKENVVTAQPDAQVQDTAENTGTDVKPAVSAGEDAGGIKSAEPDIMVTPQKESPAKKTAETSTASSATSPAVPAIKIDSEVAAQEAILQSDDIQPDSNEVPGIVLNKIKTSSLSAAGPAPVAVLPTVSVMPQVAPPHVSAPPMVTAPHQESQSLSDIPVQPDASSLQSPPETIAPSPVHAQQSAPIAAAPSPRRQQTQARVSSASAGSGGSGSLRDGTHCVTVGETLSDIALMYYKDKTKWIDIYEANKDTIEKGSLEAGQIIKIP